MKMTKFQLTQMLFIGGCVPSVVIDSSGNSHIGIVQAITRSCVDHNFIVRMNTQYNNIINTIDIYVRTID